jgi:spermidine/putrescine transport system substrate-binding protein
MTLACPSQDGLERTGDRMPRRRMGVRILVAWIVGSLAAACGAAPEATPPLPGEIVITSWAEYMPAPVLEAFTAETGITVEYRPYASQDEAVASLQAGAAYDLVLVDSVYIPSLIDEGLLAELDYRNIPNFKNVSANFRDLVFDPGNRYSIPFHWGTSGLLVRTDLVKKPVEHWVDLWDPEVGGRVAVWPIQHSLIPIALMADGHAADSVDPDDLQDAAARLGWLRDHAILVANEEATIIPYLVSGQAVAAYGWAYDADQAARQSAPIAYVLPSEGTIIWQDLFVVPASSPNQPGAERFLDFILRPEISARIIEESRYAMANEAAMDLLDPATRDNPLIFPPPADLVNATSLPPRSAEGQALWNQVWAETIGSMEAGS